MSETPNFALIAGQIASTLMPEPSPRNGREVSAIADQLRAIWNARGAADIAAVEGELAQIGLNATSRLQDTLDSAVRSLDK
jgi:hypothetical protein